MFNPVITTQPSTLSPFAVSRISTRLPEMELPKVRVKREITIKVKTKASSQNDVYLKIIRSNDSLALNKLYNDFFKRVQSFILKKGGRFEDAQDVFQEAFMVVVEKVRSNTLELSCSLYSYLLRVCRNIWFNKLKRKGNQCLDLHEDICISEKNEIYDEFNQRIKERLYQEKLALLPLDKQEVLRLYMEGYSMKEIADVMGYASAKYAKKKKCVSQQMLVKLVKADPIYRELTTV